MDRVLASVRWVLFGAYAIGGAVALMMASPRGLKALGMSVDALTFLPAKILSLPWSLVPWLLHLDPVTTLALLAVGYMFNLGIGRMLAQG
ncbi:MAG: hypothetical protein V4707_06680 [Pseudomonadota bacterium]